MKKKARLVSLVGEMFSKEEYVLAKTGGERIRLVMDELWEYVHPRAGDMVPLVSKLHMFGKGMSGQQQGYYGAQIVPSRAPPSITPVKLQTPGHARINSVVAPTKFVMVPSQIPSVEAQIPRNAHTISSVAPSPHTSGTPRLLKQPPLSQVLQMHSSPSTRIARFSGYASRKERQRRGQVVSNSAAEYSAFYRSAADWECAEFRAGEVEWRYREWNGELHSLAVCERR
jgi:hypothetical protein